MPLDVKVDEDLPLQVAELLRNLGHRVLTVADQGMGGVKDSLLWEAVQAERRFLVIEPLVKLMRRVVRGEVLDQLRGTVAVATPRGLRIRRTP